MLYWLTGTAASSAQLYYENMHGGSWRQEPVTVPTGVAGVAQDLAIRRYAERGHNIVRWSEFDRGGHFVALEARTCTSAMCEPSSAPCADPSAQRATRPAQQLAGRARSTARVPGARSVPLLHRQFP
jgi:hypothetical protein